MDPMKNPQFASYYTANYGTPSSPDHVQRVYSAWMLKNNMGNPMSDKGISPITKATPGTGLSLSGNVGAVIGDTTMPTGQGQQNVGGQIIPATSGGGGSYPQYGSSGGGGGQSPLLGGGGSGGSTTSTTGSTSSLGGGGMTPFIKSVTTNTNSNNSGLIQQLIQTLSQGTADANKAGMAQYTNLLNAVKGGSSAAMGMYKQAGQQIDNFGASQKQDIEQTRLNERGQDTQDLIGKGLGNTTILNNMLGGADTRATRANTNLGGTIAGMKSGLLTQQAGAKIDLTRLMGDSILSKQNTAPDMGMILSLLQSLGGTGGGSGARLAPRITV